MPDFSGESFQSEGKVPIDLGWLAVYSKRLSSQEVLMPMHAGTLILATKMEVVEHQTKPPARYSEATLLSAMEGAGKLLEEEALREAMHQRGLGTPATRAAPACPSSSITAPAPPSRASASR